MGSRGGVAHAAPPAPQQRGGTPLRTERGSGDFGRRTGPMRVAVGRDRGRHGRAETHRLARRPAPRRLVASADHDGRRPARPDGGRRVPGGHVAAATDPDRCAGNRRRTVDRDAAELAARSGAAGRPGRRGAAAGGPGDHPVGAAAGTGGAWPDTDPEAAARHRKVVGTERLCRGTSDAVPAARDLRPVGPGRRRSSA